MKYLRRFNENIKEQPQTIIYLSLIFMYEEINKPPQYLLYLSALSRSKEWPIHIPQYLLYVYICFHIELNCNDIYDMYYYIVPTILNILISLICHIYCYLLLLYILLNLRNI